MNIASPLRSPLALLPLLVLLSACGGTPERPGGNAPGADAGTAQVSDTGGSEPVPALATGSGTAVSGSASSPDAPSASAPAAAGRNVSTTIRSPVLLETSGLAVSRRDSDVLWAVNDGGHVPALHALGADGRDLGSYPVAISNRDWEDLAAFRLDGAPVLLIADTGDNRRQRDSFLLHLFDEPEVDGTAASGTPQAPIISLRARFEDGPHDVESVAVDETTRTIWLLTKEPIQAGRGVAGGAYALPLDLQATDTANTPLIARRRATLADVARSFTESLAAAVAGIDLAQPTAFDITQNGRRGCFLTYQRVRCLELADGESWDESFARQPPALANHGLEQAEALALSPDGATVWMTSEGAFPPLIARALP